MRFPAPSGSALPNGGKTECKLNECDTQVESLLHPSIMHLKLKKL